jgi:hypothetical protein
MFHVAPVPGSVVLSLPDQVLKILVVVLQAMFQQQTISAHQDRIERQHFEQDLRSLVASPTLLPSSGVPVPPGCELFIVPSASIAVPLPSVPDYLAPISIVPPVESYMRDPPSSNGFDQLHPRFLRHYQPAGHGPDMPPHPSFYSPFMAIPSECLHCSKFKRTLDSSMSL